MAKRPNTNSYAALAMLSQVPDELLCLVFGGTDRNDLPAIYGTCRRFQDVVRRHRDYFMQIEAPIKLYKEQYALYRKLVGDTRRTLAVRAPMGVGKTSLMIMRAIDRLKEGLFVLIVAPVKTFDTWRNELTKFKFDLQKDPQIRIVHCSREAHVKQFCAADVETMQPCLILTTPHYLRSHYIRPHYPTGTVSKPTVSVRPDPSAKLRELFAVRDFAIIVDEAHTCEHQVRWHVALPRMRQCLYMSASHMMGLAVDGSYNVVIDETETRTFATIKPTAFPPGGFLEILRGYNKVVIFTGDAAQSAIATLLQVPGSSEFTFLRYEGSRANIIAKFTKTPKSVLVCNYRAASEGINLQMVDAAIFHRFETNGITASEQCLGRIRRRNNTYSTVAVYMWEGTAGSPIDNLVSNLRSRFNLFVALQSSRIYTAANKKCQEHIARTVQEIQRREGIDPSQLTDWEIYFICGLNHGSSPFAALDERPENAVLPLERLLAYSLY